MHETITETSTGSEVRYYHLVSSPIKNTDGQVQYVIELTEDITERKQAEETTRKSEKRLGLALHGADLGLWDWSIETNKHTFNERWAEMLGYSLDEMESESSSWEKLVHPDDLQTAHRRMSRHLAGDEPSYEMEQRMRTKSGEWKWVLSRAKVTEQDEDGRPSRITGTHLDITDRKISENLIHIRLALLEFAALHSLEELLQKTLDEVGSLTNSPIGFYHCIGEDERTISLQTWSTRTVQEFCRAEGKGLHYQVDQGGMWGDAVRERRPVIHNDLSKLPHRKGIPEGHPAVIRELVVPIMRSDRIVAILGIGNKPTDYTEKDVKSVSYLADVAWEIAQLKRAETDLDERDKQYHTLFEESIDGLYSVARDGTITDANLAFCELFGYSKEEMIGKEVVELYLDPADRPRFQKELEENGLVKDYAVKLRKRDGTELDCLVTSSLHFERDGRITGYRGILRDLTERKKLQMQLIQAQKMEAVGTLAGGIAHDFNNIIFAISGYTELALEDLPATSPTRSDLDRVLNAAKRAGDMVKQILTFSRQSQPERKPLDIGSIVKEGLKFLRASIPTTIEIRRNIEPNLEKIFGDPTQIHQVLMNFCTNAAHAMRKTKGILTVDLSGLELDPDFAAQHPPIVPGKFLRLNVSDTGHGIPRALIDRVFEPYFTTKKAGEGTGLGLSVVHGIVKSHGGTITVYSEPGKGTSFSVYLPVIEAEMVDGEDAFRDYVPTGNERILCVDDEEPIMELVKRMLEPIGYDVVGKTSAVEAVELFRSDPYQFDLVITDFTMPKMTGTELARELTAIRPDMPVILCTGFSETVTEEEAKAFGIQSVIMKPILKGDISRTVRRILDQRVQKEV
ncbi:MAG: PAS domain S-box protein [Pseudomonadota bacterium]